MSIVINKHIEHLKKEAVKYWGESEQNGLIQRTIKALEQQQARIKELTENLDLALNYVKNLEIAIDDIGGYTQEQIYENVPECNFNFNTALSLLSLPKPPEAKS